MKKVKGLWMPVLLGALLMATLVGVAGARPGVRPEASPALQNHMISPHHCVSCDEANDYVLYGEKLVCNTGSCVFGCPIKPPHQGLIRVQRLAVYFYDNAAGDVRIWLPHVYPKSASCVSRVSDAYAPDGAAKPQVFTLNPANFKVSVLQDLAVRVHLDSGGQEFYGAKLRYEPL